MNQKFLKSLVSEKTDDTLTAYATVEAKDREGDIIRIAGLDFDHSPQSTLKVYGTAHSYKSMPDGTPPIIGVVKEIKKTTTEADGKNVPAVSFVMAYAKEGNELTAFARKFKGLFDAGTLDSFSVGIIPKQYTALKGGRYDITKSTCFEISAAPLPVNKYATVIKSWKEELGDDIDPDEILEDRLIQLQKSVDSRGDADARILQRFDSLESSLTALLKGAARPQRGDTEPESKAALLKSLRQLLET